MNEKDIIPKIVINKDVDENNHFIRIIGDYFDRTLRLSKRALKLWGFIVSKVPYNDNEISLNTKEIHKHFNWTYKTIRELFKEISELELMVRINSDDKVYINPFLMLHGEDDVIIKKYNLPFNFDEDGNMIKRIKK